MPTYTSEASQGAPAPTQPVPEWRPRSAASVTVLLLLAVLLGAPAFVLFLLVPDFLARTLNQGEWTYLARLGGPIVRRLLSPATLARRSRWAPKRFASALGLGMLAMILTTSFAGFAGVAMGLTATMAILASLEALFGICVGCQIYTKLLGRLGLVEPCPNGHCSL